jgi:hypothetical protein
MARRRRQRADLGLTPSEAADRLVAGARGAATWAAPKLRAGASWAAPRAAAAAKRSVPLLRRKIAGPVEVWMVLAGAAAVGVGGYLWYNRDRNVITSREQFVTKLWAALGASGLGSASKKLLIAQFALESGWGRGTAAVKGFNYGNITAGSTWDGGIVYGWDESCTLYGHLCVPIIQRFRRYDSDAEAMQDFLRFLSTSRYKRSMSALREGRLAAYASALRDEGYYTAAESKYVNGMNAAMPVIEKVLGGSAPRVA